MSEKTGDKLGFWSIVLLAINAIIGSGIFLTPGSVVQQAGSKALVVYLIAAIFAAIDYILAMFQIHIPSPIGRPFIDLGYTFVVIGTLFLGYKYGLISGIIGLVLFDLLNGYAAHTYLTVMEVVIIASVGWLMFKTMHFSPKISKIILIGIATGLSKIIAGFLRYVIEGLIIGMQGKKLIAMAALSMPASIVTGIAMFVTVPLFFNFLNKVMKIVISTN